MPLIIGLSIYFAVATVIAFIYQLWRKRPLVRALHYAVIFGLFTVMVVALLAVVLDILDITPEPALQG